MNKNRFYVLKGEMQKASSGTYNTETGEQESSSTVGQYCVPVTLSGIKQNSNMPVLAIPAPDINFISFRLFYYDDQLNYLGFTEVYMQDLAQGDYSDLLGQTNMDKAQQVKCSFTLDISETELSQMTQTDIDAMLTHVWLYAGYEIKEPHYSKLENKYKKETNQVFLRSNLEGTVKLIGNDFDFINKQDLETKFLFMVLSDSNLVVINTFLKTDCKLDNFRHVIELKLTSIDKYSKIINKYDNTYDLIKLAPAITPLTLTKRLLYQFYIQGASSVTCYANGTYWEQDVNDVVDDADELKKKYYFAENLSKQEFYIAEEVDSDFTGTYIHEAGTPPSTWINQNKSTVKMVGISDLSHCASDAYGNKTYRWFNTGKKLSGQEVGAVKNEWLFALKIYNSGFGDRLAIYSTDVFVLNGWNINSNIASMGQDGQYTFKKSADSTDTYDLDVINYTVWARILADVDSAVEPSTQQTKTLYDLPSDDFVSSRINYRKCIGMMGLTVQQSGATVKYPTKYGRTDYNTYFTSNIVSALTRTSHKPVPISRSTWANTSIWAIIPDNWSVFESQFRTTFILKDAFSLVDVIKAVLRKIDPLIKFEATAEYSQFLYQGDTDTPIIPFDGSRIGYYPYIAPKSNVLKGNYDQAAQKAEITFEQIMDMLRDCFRCYWYIDSDNRLRIEHISYFMNGLSYGTTTSQLDLTTKLDKFNRKVVLYAQEQVSYTKDDLNSRYEFSWMDNSTETFDDIDIDINSVYTQQDKTEEINSEVFSTDIDLMLYAPDLFSNDGFALMMADSNGKVPISSISSLRDDEYAYNYSVTPQNYLCSWLYLARYYMLDMPARKIIYSRAPLSDAYRVTGIKQFINQDVEFQTMQDIDLNKTIKTSLGNGIIDSMSKNIDTGLISATLVFSPQ